MLLSEQRICFVKKDFGKRARKRFRTEKKSAIRVFGAGDMMVSWSRMLLSSTTFAQRYERSPCNAPSALVPSRTAVAVVRSRKAAASLCGAQPQAYTHMRQPDVLHLFFIQLNMWRPNGQVLSPPPNMSTPVHE